MANRRVRFTFEGDAVREPVIYLPRPRVLGRDQHPDGRCGARVRLVVLELEGDHDEIDRSLAWVEAKGVRVDPVSGDVVES